MPNVAYDKFREQHPEYPESLRAHYWESVVSCYPPILQNSFMVELGDRAIIDQLLKLGKPEYIYCGTKELERKFGKAYPHLKPIIKLHGFYEESICMVMFATEMKVPERKT
jgi:hypothetical protein